MAIVLFDSKEVFTVFDGLQLALVPLSRSSDRGFYADDDNDDYFTLCACARGNYCITYKSTRHMCACLWVVQTALAQ